MTGQAVCASDTFVAITPLLETSFLQLLSQLFSMMGQFRSPDGVLPSSVGVLAHARRVENRRTQCLPETAEPACRFKGCQGFCSASVHTVPRFFTFHAPTIPQQRGRAQAATAPQIDQNVVYHEDGHPRRERRPWLEGATMHCAVMVIPLDGPPSSISASPTVC
jgi:hypothetical protein